MGGRGSGQPLARRCPRPTSGRHRALASARYERRGARLALDSGFRRNDGGLDAINRAPTEKPTLVSLWSPRERGDVDSRLRGNDGSRLFSDFRAITSMTASSAVRARSYPRFLYVVYYIIIGFVRLVTRLLLAVRVTGGADFPRTGPVLVAANHLSYFDIPFLLIFLPRPPIFVAKQEVTAFPLVGRLVNRLGTVSIRRGESDRRAIRHSLAVLENDDVLLIFPGGHAQSPPRAVGRPAGCRITGTSLRGSAGECGDHRGRRSSPCGRSSAAASR